MRTVVQYDYSYFKIFRMWGSAGATWYWDMDQDELADATLYKGSMRIAEAYDPKIVGTIYQGFYEYRKAAPHLSRYLQFQRCVNDVDTEWFCLHGHDCVLETSFLQLMGAVAVPPGTSLVVLEGLAHAELPGRLASVAAMNHVKPRETAYEVNGNAKAFLIRPAGPLPALEAPEGVTPRASAPLRTLR